MILHDFLSQGQNLPTPDPDRKKKKNTLYLEVPSLFLRFFFNYWKEQIYASLLSHHL